jgi:hypothetical protein
LQSALTGRALRADRANGALQPAFTRWAGWTLQTTLSNRALSARYTLQPALAGCSSRTLRPRRSFRPALADRPW